MCFLCYCESIENCWKHTTKFVSVTFLVVFCCEHLFYNKLSYILCCQKKGEKGGPHAGEESMWVVTVWESDGSRSGHMRRVVVLVLCAT
jgi:hypothetical protein